MRWARRGVRIDRAACAWLIRRFIDERTAFVLVDDPVSGTTPSRSRRRDPFDTRRRAAPPRPRRRLRDRPRGLSVVRSDDELLRITGPVFDGLREHSRREALLGRVPA